jgi:DNA-binding transcriptional LysR family regulator
MTGTLGSPVSLLGLRSGSLLESYAIFDEVATCGSMSHAAWNLDLDISVVSRQVAAMERAFDCMLFERHRRGVRLTQAGRAVAEHTRRVLQMHGRLREELDDMRELRAGSLRIAATDGAISGPLSRTLSSFVRKHPGVQIELFRASSEQVVPSLHRGDAELGAGLDVQPEPGIEIVARLPDILAAIVAPGHRLARRRQIRLDELEGESIGTFERNSGVGRCLQRVAAQGIRASGPTLVTNSLEALKQMAASGVGVALLCPHSAEKELRAGQLVAVPLDADGQVTITLEFCALRAARRSFAMTAFLTELLRCGGPAIVAPETRDAKAGEQRDTGSA